MLRVVESTDLVFDIWISLRGFHWSFIERRWLYRCLACFPNISSSSVIRRLSWAENSIKLTRTKLLSLRCIETNSFCLFLLKALSFSRLLIHHTLLATHCCSTLLLAHFRCNKVWWVVSHAVEMVCTRIHGFHTLWFNYERHAVMLV